MTTKTTESSAADTILGLVFLPLSIIFRGVVVSFMWAWFIVPLGVMSIGKAHALGISALMGLLTDSSDSSEKSLAGRVIGSMIAYAIILGFAYIYHSLM